MSLGKNVTAIVYHTHGNPAEVLRIEEKAWPIAARDEVVVTMRAAPINPADLNAIEGKYPVRPALPATPGFEGMGTVVEKGNAVRGLELGTKVLLPHHIGTWCQACTVRADELVAVPQGIDDAQAAMLKINPVTAWRLLHDFASLKPGDWVIQNAANSAAGRAVIQIARELGIRTVNVVRRPELIEQLLADGGDIVECDGDDLRNIVAEKTARSKILLALNAVGGESALRLANCAAPGATIVTYGAMSLQPIRIPNGLLIFKDLRWRGFWVNQWYERSGAVERATMFDAIFDLARRGVLRTAVERIYPLGDAIAAVAHAQQNKRAGKIVFEMAARER